MFIDCTMRAPGKKAPIGWCWIAQQVKCLRCECECALLAVSFIGVFEILVLTINFTIIKYNSHQSMRCWCWCAVCWLLSLTFDFRWKLDLRAYLKSDGQTVLGPSHKYNRSTPTVYHILLLLDFSCIALSRIDVLMCRRVHTKTRLLC